MGQCRKHAKEEIQYFQCSINLNYIVNCSMPTQSFVNHFLDLAEMGVLCISVSGTEACGLNWIILMDL